MEHHDDEAFLVDVINYSKLVARWIDGIKPSDFIESDEDQHVMRRHSVDLHLQRIGEAASQISENMKYAYPKVPWTEMVGLRNRLVHRYHEPNEFLIWNTATTLIPRILEGFKISKRKR